MIYPLLNELNALVEEGSVNKSKHYTYDLWIYNYSHKAIPMYGNTWPQALSEARGLVLDGDGNVIARAFPKFWNLDINNIRKEPCTITEKMDGSMILAFNYLGDTIVASRGSFQSEQALWASSLLQNDYPAYTPFTDHTDVFELIHPDNRIVVDYGKHRKLVYLSTFCKDGFHYSFDGIEEFTGIEQVKRWDFPSVLDAVNCPETKNREGFVVEWEDGTREKIKFDEYKRLHRVVFGTSAWTIWDCLRNGQTLPTGVCPELDEWAAMRAGEFGHRYWDLRDAIMFRYDVYASTQPATRKDFALLVNGDEHKSAMFLLYDGKMEELEAYLWKQLEPKKDTLFRKESQYV